MIKTPEQKLTRNPRSAGYTNPLKSYDVPAKDNPDGTINVHAQPVYGIDPNREPIDLYMACRTIPGGTLDRQGGSTTFGAASGFNVVVPAGKRWILLNWAADVTASGTVGNRTVGVVIFSAAASTMWVGATGAATAAGQICGYDVGFGAPVNVPSTAVRRTLSLAANTNTQVRESCSLNILSAGQFINIRDYANTDVADVVLFAIEYIEIDA